MANIGKAYGFFKCSASKEAIELEMPTIRKLAETPSNLELSLTEGMNNVKGDDKLVSLAQEAKKIGLNYMLEATYPNSGNKNAADEVAIILNQAYQSHLYKKEEPFYGDIIYKENGEYVFAE